MGEAKIPLPGMLVFDQVVLARLLRCPAQPKHAFNIVAIKDVRGVSARYGSHADDLSRPLLRRAS
jgi:hypothetical protein